MKELIRRCFHGLGYELHRYPEACERLEPHLEMVIRTNPVDAVIDVGANVGQFAVETRRLKPGVPLYSFEPNPSVFIKLKAAAASDALWQIFNLALGAEEGETTLNVTEQDVFSSILAPNALGEELYKTSIHTAKQVPIKVRRVDDVLGERLRDLQSILFKVDTQGYDKQVLLGAPEVLQRSSIVVTECAIQPIYENGFDFVDALIFMRQAGFMISGCFPLARDRRCALVEVNCVFVRASNGV